MIIYQSNTLIPDHLAMKAREIFLSWPHANVVKQNDNQYYRKMMNNHSEKQKFGNHTMTDTSWFPDDENYTAYLEELNNGTVPNKIYDEDVFVEVLNNYIGPKLEEITGLPKNPVTGRIDINRFSCTRMPPGGHYRIHKDDWASRYGFVWYLNLNWKWDWGGLFLTVQGDGSAVVTRPAFNTLIINRHYIDDDLPNPWHCVTRVEDHAKESRLSMIGFI